MLVPAENGHRLLQGIQFRVNGKGALVGLHTLESTEANGPKQDHKKENRPCLSTEATSSQKSKALQASLGLAASARSDTGEAETESSHGGRLRNHFTLDFEAEAHVKPLVGRT